MSLFFRMKYQNSRMILDLQVVEFDMRNVNNIVIHYLTVRINVKSVLIVWC